VSDRFGAEDAATVGPRPAGATPAVVRTTTDSVDGSEPRAEL